jgi:hypothetical protein
MTWTTELGKYVRTSPNHLATRGADDPIPTTMFSFDPASPSDWLS